jgi:hypothetical protein
MSTDRPDDAHSPNVFFRLAAAQFPTGAPTTVTWWAARELLDDCSHATQTAAGAAAAVLAAGRHGRAPS